MDAPMVIDLLRHALWAAFWLCLPLLAVGFVAGVALSLTQIVTSIQDSSFSVAPRLVAFLATLLLFLPWMLNRLVGYTTDLFGDLGRYAR
jgi:flagellar biosynthetic protein FliQ